MYKGPTDKPRQVGLRVGGGDWWGRREWGGGKWRHLYLNNNKREFKEIK